MKHKIAWLFPAIILVFGAVLISLGVGAEEKSGSEKQKTITVTGEVVDLWCYIDHQARGAEHKGCAIACAKAGNPIGLVDNKGHVYLLMGSEKHQAGRDVFLDRMAEQVSVTGRLVSRGGIRALYASADSVKAAGAQPESSSK